MSNDFSCNFPDQREGIVRSGGGSAPPVLEEAKETLCALKSKLPKRAHSAEGDLLPKKAARHQKSFCDLRDKEEIREEVSKFALSVLQEQQLIGLLVSGLKKGLAEGRYFEQQRFPLIQEVKNLLPKIVSEKARVLGVILSAFDGCSHKAT